MTCRPVWTAIHGDCRQVLRDLPADHFDACVTDPPYDLGFMGKAWDTHSAATDPALWATVLRTLKPGAHLLAFGGTRTYHRLVCAIEDAGFEIRDTLAWMYGQGFPKSLDIGKALDKLAGAEREVLREGAPLKRLIPGADQNRDGSWIKDNGRVYVPTETAPATPEAQRWAGWGTALKPAFEPIVLARKPLIGSVAENILRHGCGGLNVDGCRVETLSARPLRVSRRNEQSDTDRIAYGKGLAGSVAAGEFELGRWPANVIHDGSDEVLACFPDSKGQQGAVTGMEPSPVTGAIYGQYRGRPASEPRGDTGSAARFFYCAKASTADRAGSKHPTVKPLALMRYLCKLVTPPGGDILDPFAGSGTTLQAAWEQAFSVFGIEQDATYHADILRRMTLATTQQT